MEDKAARTQELTAAALKLATSAEADKLAGRAAKRAEQGRKAAAVATRKAKVTAAKEGAKLSVAAFQALHEAAEAARPIAERAAEAAKERASDMAEAARPRVELAAKATREAVSNAAVAALGLHVQVHQVVDGQVHLHPAIGDPTQALQHLLHEGDHFSPLWPRMQSAEDAAGSEPASSHGSGSDREYSDEGQDAD